MSGDRHPVHIDPATARAAGFRAPPLPGLCTWAMAAKALDARGEKIQAEFPSMVSAAALALFGILLWPGKRRRRLFLSLVAFLSIAATATLSGCGGGFSFAPAAKTYTITVTATGASETQSTTVQLTVQQ